MNKRGNGEGSITKRQDGRWEARITVGMNGPRPIRKSIYGKTRAEVAAKMTKSLRELHQGIRVRTDERETVGVYLSRWLATSVRPRVRPRTYELYELIVRRHLDPHVGHYRLTKLAPEDVQAMLGALSAAGLAPRTVRTVRSVLRQALQQALKWSLVQRNVAGLVDVPKAAEHEVQPFTIEEARQFLASVHGHRLEALFLTATLTGMRRGEVLALQWDDVDFENRSLRIAGGLQRIDGKLQRMEPKTARSRRTLAVPDFVISALREHRLRQKEERLHAGSEWRDTGYVFTTLFGKPLEPRNVTRLFNQLVAKAGLRTVRFHDLRHCYATLQLAEGVPARVVMEQLGHSQISTTLDIYSHVTQTIHRESADRMGALFSATGS